MAQRSIRVLLNKYLSDPIGLLTFTFLIFTLRQNDPTFKILILKTHIPDASVQTPERAHMAFILNCIRVAVPGTWDLKNLTVTVSNMTSDKNTEADVIFSWTCVYYV